MAIAHSTSFAGGHPVNEDAYEVRPHPEDSGCLMCALADGQGGRSGGLLAAQTAIHTALELAVDIPVDAILQSDAWLEILSQADQAVAGKRDAGLTTLIGLAAQGNTLVGASCGDSAVWVLDGAGRGFELTARQRKNPPVGSGEAFFVPFAVQLVPPWLVLVMSDGVWKYVGWDRLRTAAMKLRGQELVDAVREAARMPGSGGFQDDFTLVVIQDA